MNSPLKIAVTGASGRMGQMLIKTIATGENMVLSGALEHAGHNWLGQDIGLVSGGPEAGVIVSDQIRDCLLYTSPSPRDMRRSRMPSSA